MILRRGEVVIEGTMTELREKFGSIRYEVWFILPEDSGMEMPADAQKSGNLWMTTIRTVPALNTLTSAINESGGVVERIESKYPSLEEILVKIGK